LKPLTSKIDRLEQIGSVSQSSVWKVNLTYGILFLSTSSGPFAVKEVQTFHRDEKKLRREIALLWLDQQHFFYNHLLHSFHKVS